MNKTSPNSKQIGEDILSIQSSCQKNFQGTKIKIGWLMAFWSWKLHNFFWIFLCVFSLVLFFRPYQNGQKLLTSWIFFCECYMHLKDLPKKIWGQTKQFSIFYNFSMKSGPFIVHLPPHPTPVGDPDKKFCDLSDSLSQDIAFWRSNCVFRACL